MRELPLIRRLRNRRRSKGQSLVEFALILPVFILFFAATLDLGRIAAAQVTINNAAREGAYQASQTPGSFDNTQPCPADAESNLVVCRTILESSDSVIDIAPADIALTCDPSCTSGLGNRVTVRVTGHFQLLTPILAGFFGGTQNITFSAASTHQIETFPPPPSPVVLTSAPPTVAPSASASASPAPSGACVIPSAGFDYSFSPSSKKAPTVMTVADRSTSANCNIDSWMWTWKKADGTVLGTRPDQGPLGGWSINFSTVGQYIVTLEVGNAAGWSTEAAVSFTVKP